MNVKHFVFCFFKILQSGCKRLSFSFWKPLTNQELAEAVWKKMSKFECKPIVELVPDNIKKIACDWIKDIQQSKWEQLDTFEDDVKFEIADSIFNDQICSIVNELNVIFQHRY